ncbi:MAG: threonine ammonia-lyase [Nitrospirota bacterium]
MISLSDIKNAQEKIKDHVHRTPLIYSNSFSTITGAEIYLKTENLQKTGSFKVRGAFNRLAGLREKVIAASMGNHAQAVAFAASKLGLRAKVVMPMNAPIVKVEATRAYGAEVELYGENFREALDLALSRSDYTFVHAFDDERIIAGQGTIGLEIVTDIEGLDVVLVPVGGGGLISGVSLAVKNLAKNVSVIGVQTEAAPSAYLSMKENRICEKAPESTIADGIAIGKIGEKTFDIMKHHVDEIMTVKEESIALAILLFMERKKLVVEGAGAVALAALFEESERFKGKKIVLIVSGGNIDFTLVDRIIHKGLIASGRVGFLEVTIDDAPASMAAITGVISSARGNIINIFQDRFAEDLPIGKTRVVFILETKGKSHLEEILSAMREKGFPVLMRHNPISKN